VADAITTLFSLPPTVLREEAWSICAALCGRFACLCSPRVAHACAAGAYHEPPQAALTLSLQRNTVWLLHLAACRCCFFCILLPSSASVAGMEVLEESPSAGISLAV